MFTLTRITTTLGAVKIRPKSREFQREKTIKKSFKVYVHIIHTFTVFKEGSRDKQNQKLMDLLSETRIKSHF